MSLEKDDARWLQRGTQRAAVARVLQKPMTGSQICIAARALSPRIQLRDVWHLIQQLRQRNLVVCLNPRLVTGRLYCLTDEGKSSVAKAFGLIVQCKPGDVDWRKYAWVVRAKIRRLTLIGLSELESRTAAPQTATAVRRHLRNAHPVGLNPVVRALGELLRLGLVRQAGVTRQRGCKVYRLTPAGQRIVEQMKS